ncbi:SHOCT domain-containing protein [Saccharicrinis fermentans]|uniref:SHOCT domain-containing protein n=1 Tax=Saccharicrinis fermentans TaxID=982 RepID=UPI0004ADF4F6|nr:SHOCT domain-containing protein [Saccharicrinis fermentans]
MKPLLTIKGQNGQLTVYYNKLTISRKGLVAFSQHGMSGDKDIYIENITGVQLKKASTLFHGFIQFSFNGSAESKGGLEAARKDENSIIIKKSQNTLFIHAKSMIEDLMRKSKEQATTIVNQTSELDEIEKLATLKEKGYITEDEFNTKKKQLLGI